MKYIDYKTTVWQRIYFNNDTDMQKIIKLLEQNYIPNELCDEDLGFKEVETMYDTEEFIRPIENDGQSTIEVYEDNGFKMIWDNSFNSEIKRKQ